MVAVEPMPVTAEPDEASAVMTDRVMFGAADGRSAGSRCLEASAAGTMTAWTTYWRK